jgi:hypothetical protein
VVGHKAAEMLAIFDVIQATKQAVEKFEEGEISAQDAVRLIQQAAVRVRAA